MPGLYSHTTRATGTILTATIYNGDHQNHINNAIPQQHDDYSQTALQMRSKTDPGEVGTESLATSTAGEIERLRFAIGEIKGTSEWYETRPLWEKISDTVPPVGNTVSINLPTGYKLFRLHIIGITPTAGAANNELYFRVVQNGVALSGAGDYFQNLVYWNSATGTIVSAANSIISLGSNGNSPTPESTDGVIEFNESAVGTRLKLWGQTRGLNNTGSRTLMINGSEVLTSTFRCDTLNFGWVGGTNFATVGRFILEGLR